MRQYIYRFIEILMFIYQIFIKYINIFYNILFFFFKKYKYIRYSIYFISFVYKLFIKSRFYIINFLLIILIYNIFIDILYNKLIIYNKWVYKFINSFHFIESAYLSNIIAFIIYILLFLLIYYIIYRWYIILKKDYVNTTSSLYNLFSILLLKNLLYSLYNYMYSVSFVFIMLLVDKDLKFTILSQLIKERGLNISENDLIILKSLVNLIDDSNKDNIKLQINSILDYYVIGQNDLYYKGLLISGSIIFLLGIVYVGYYFLSNISNNNNGDNDHTPIRNGTNFVNNNNIIKSTDTKHPTLFDYKYKASSDTSTIKKGHDIACDNNTVYVNTATTPKINLVNNREANNHIILDDLNNDNNIIINSSSNGVFIVNDRMQDDQSDSGDINELLSSFNNYANERIIFLLIIGIRYLLIFFNNKYRK